MTILITKGVVLPPNKAGGMKTPERTAAEKLKPDEGFYAPPGIHNLAGWRSFASRLNATYPARTYRAAQIKDRIYVKRIK